MIIGQSGHGKSTIVDALCFVLYGQPFRKVNKGALVNTVNNKACRVELSLETEEAKYVVVRGMKPDVFTIHRNDQLVEQEAASKDYQKWLEMNVLKMNMKTFIQIVILGYANHTPFMEMNASQRRTMVDEILGLDVFTKMNVILSAKAKELKNDITIIERETELMKSSLNELKSTVMKIHSQDKEKSVLIEAEIAELNAIIQREQSEADTINAAIAEKLPLVQELASMNTKSRNYTSVISKLEANIDNIEKDIKFFKDHDNCATCLQPITIEHKTSIITKKSNEVQTFSDGMKKAGEIAKSLNEKILAINVIANEISQFERQLYQKTTNISAALKDITSKQKQIQSLQESDGSIASELSKKVLQIVNDIQEKTKNREYMVQTRYLYEVSQVLLKDDGIKAQIIKEYIPALNQMVNEYLDQMNFHLKFELNEEFDEKILSRFRDNLTFYSLSQGEQSRLNLAMTLAWRRLAEMRNSASVNILFLDEMLDSAISAADIESVWKLIESMSTKTNIFVISHQPNSLYDKIHSVIEVKKSGNFSHIEGVSSDATTNT
jgi:DNA repair exonuclease SbcCD ATPase subunit